MTWNREVFGQLEMRKARALEQVAFWDAKERSCILSMEEVEAQEGAREEYKEWVLLEEIFWRQKSREVWLKEGDRNNFFSFFHKMVNATVKGIYWPKLRLTECGCPRKRILREGWLKLFRICFLI